MPDLVGLIEMNKSSFCGGKASFLISALLSIIWVEKDPGFKGEVQSPVFWLMPEILQREC